MNQAIIAAGKEESSSNPLSGVVTAQTTSIDAIRGMLDMKGNCIPGKTEIPGLVQQVSASALQLLAYRGLNSGGHQMSRIHYDPSKYGDPQVTPIVLVTPNPSTGEREMQFYMTIVGITCAHCVKIVETVVKGCPGSPPPIDGLIDAVADMDSAFLIVKIDNISNCRRIAWESARNLSMVGYTAKAKSYTIPSGMSLENVYGLMERTIPGVVPMEGFNWDLDCDCPDNNVTRVDCSRHSQFDKSLEILDAFSKVEILLSDPDIYKAAHGELQAEVSGYDGSQQKQEYKTYQIPIQDSSLSGGGGVDGDAYGTGNGGTSNHRQHLRGRQSIGPQSFGALGGSGRLFSMTSETTFARSMSGLSALSIDWENMDDFDINVDHSAGINNDIINQQNQQQGQAAQTQQGTELEGNGGGQKNGGCEFHSERRSSLKSSQPVSSNSGPVHNVTFQNV